VSDRILITRKETHPDGSVTLYGIDDDGQVLMCTFPAGATVARIVCPTCGTPLAGDAWCPQCLTPEQITGGES
jgi:rubrerythrin